MASITVIFAILVGWFLIDYQALITENKNLEAELESEKKSLKLLQKEHLDYVTDIDNYERNIDHWKQDIISNKDTAKNLQQEIKELKKKVPCIKILMYAAGAILDAEERNKLVKSRLWKNWDEVLQYIKDKKIVEVFGTKDQLEMLEKHFKQMKELGVRVMIFSMKRSKEWIKSLFSWDEVKHYYPVEIVDKPPNDSPLMCNQG